MKNTKRTPEKRWKNLMFVQQKKKFELYTQTTGTFSLHSENTNSLVKDKIMNLKV